MLNLTVSFTGDDYFLLKQGKETSASPVSVQ